MDGGGGRRGLNQMQLLLFPFSFCGSFPLLPVWKLAVFVNNMRQAELKQCLWENKAPKSICLLGLLRECCGFVVPFIVDAACWVWLTEPIVVCSAAVDLWLSQGQAKVTDQFNVWRTFAQAGWFQPAFGSVMKRLQLVWVQNQIKRNILAIRCILIALVFEARNQWFAVWLFLAVQLTYLGHCSHRGALCCGL